MPGINPRADELLAVFARLKGLLAPYASRLAVTAGGPTACSLTSPAGAPSMPTAPPVWRNTAYELHDVGSLSHSGNSAELAGFHDVIPRATGRTIGA